MRSSISQLKFFTRSIYFIISYHIYIYTYIYVNTNDCIPNFVFRELTRNWYELAQTRPRILGRLAMPRSIFRILEVEISRGVVHALRPFMMRIRFRASDFGLVAKINSCKIETGFLCGDDARVVFFLLV